MKKIVGITGGIASGKSTVSQYLISKGYKVIDSDVISKQLSLKGNPLYQAIVEEFGSEYLLPNLDLDRLKLGKMIFQNSKARDRLNQISHPLIVQEMQKMIKKTAESFIFLDIPLLFEGKLSYLCDTIVCVYVDRKTQVKRLMMRDHISKEYAEQKISAQMDLEIKKDLADYVIESKESFEETYQNIEKIVQQIKGE